jgi:hypothetical protein
MIQSSHFKTTCDMKTLFDLYNPGSRGKIISITWLGELCIASFMFCSSGRSGMVLTRHPLKDTFPILRKTRKPLKKQMSRWSRRGAKKEPEFALRKHRHVGWYW